MYMVNILLTHQYNSFRRYTSCSDISAGDREHLRSDQSKTKDRISKWHFRKSIDTGILGSGKKLRDWLRSLTASTSLWTWWNSMPWDNGCTSHYRCFLSILHYRSRFCIVGSRKGKYCILGVSYYILFRGTWVSEVELVFSSRFRSICSLTLAKKGKLSQY